MDKIIKAIVDEYRDKPLGFDELKSVIRIALNVAGYDWTEKDFVYIIDGVLYEFHGIER